eukprot:g82388.t1
MITLCWECSSATSVPSFSPSSDVKETTPEAQAGQRTSAQMPPVPGNDASAAAIARHLQLTRRPARQLAIEHVRRWHIHTHTCGSGTLQAFSLAQVTLHLAPRNRTEQDFSCMSMWYTKANSAAPTQSARQSMWKTTQIDASREVAHILWRSGRLPAPFLGHAVTNVVLLPCVAVPVKQHCTITARASISTMSGCWERSGFRGCERSGHCCGWYGRYTELLCRHQQRYDASNQHRLEIASTAYEEGARGQFFPAACARGQPLLLALQPDLVRQQGSLGESTCSLTLGSKLLELDIVTAG